MINTILCGVACMGFGIGIGYALRIREETDDLMKKARNQAHHRVIDIAFNELKADLKKAMNELPALKYSKKYVKLDDVLKVIEKI